MRSKIAQVTARLGATGRAALAVALIGMLPLRAAGNAAFPSPGEYRIDVESTTRIQAGGVGVEQILKVDGETGRTTTVQRDSTSGHTTAPQVFPGEGPNRWCVPAGAAAPPARSAVTAAACSTTLRQLDKSTAATRAVCKGVTVDERWQRIDERTWERQIQSTQTGSPTDQPDAARRTVGAAQADASLTPAQRAELGAAKAAMPTRAQVDASMASVIADLEREAASKDPEEAAAARQALSAVRGRARAGNAPVTAIRERWRRIAETCTPG